MAKTNTGTRAGKATRVSTIAKFYLGCIEAEQAAALAVRIGGNYLEAGAGFAEEGTAVPIADSSSAAKWCSNRLRDDPKAWWPLAGRSA